MKRLSLLTAVLLSNLAWSQIDSTMDPIATDRPDITESAFITPVGWFQYEGGYQFSNSVGNLDVTTNRHQIEEVLRFGLTERFEVRAVINTNTEAIRVLLFSSIPRCSRH